MLRIVPAENVNSFFGLARKVDKSRFCLVAIARDKERYASMPVDSDNTGLRTSRTAMSLSGYRGSR